MAATISPLTYRLVAIHFVLLSIIFIVSADPFSPDGVKKLSKHTKQFHSSKPPVIIDKLPPTVRPPPQTVKKKPVNEEVSTEHVQLDTRVSAEGETVELKFKSHGRRHKLNLVKYRQQLSDIPINFVSGKTDKKKEIEDKLKDIWLMQDKLTGAPVAVQYDRVKNITKVKAGAFNIGKHEFSFQSVEDNLKTKVTKRPIPEDQTFSRDKVTLASGIKLNRTRRSISQSSLPSLTATVELVIVLDYSVYDWMTTGTVTAEGETDATVNMLLYFAHLVEMVDSHYSTMSNGGKLAISVTLAGIVVIDDATTFSDLVEDHKVEQSGNVYIDSETTLDRLSDWVTTNEADAALPPYDHVMLFTHYDMYDQADGESGTVGLAYMGTICDPSSSVSLTEVVDILTSDASTAAHELGHGLGADHDGQQGSTSLGCSDENYVMAAIGGAQTNLLNRFLFSCCSQRSFYATLYSTTEVSCLSTVSGDPNHDSSIDTKVADNLPGQVYTADDQCYHSKGTDACGDWVYQGEDFDMCTALYCISPDDQNSCTSSFSAAADGTECDTGKWCYKGQCQASGDVTSQLPDLTCDVSNCYSAEQKCTTGSNTREESYLFCYPDASLCDGISDCADGSDEAGSCELSCPTGYTQCADGIGHGLSVPTGTASSCLNDKYWCDKRSDCTDGSDEANCNYEDCPSAYVECIGGHDLEQPDSVPKYCLDLRWDCDAETDCRDASDEASCLYEDCPAFYRRCSTGIHNVSMSDEEIPRFCLANKNWCDDSVNCADGSDEDTCSGGAYCFLCRSNNECILDSDNCETDCPDEETTCKDMLDNGSSSPQSLSYLWGLITAVLMLAHL